MHLLNLTLGQFLALFGSVAALTLALYLLDRTRRRQVVSTLRFWVSAAQPAAAARRRRIQQPWSLLLQLAGIALLLLAIAQLRLGTPELPRDHVLILETSAWMAAQSSGRSLMDLARARARAYVRAAPARDRIMLVRADALTTPATAFEPDRQKLAEAIAASQPGSTALNLEQALEFAGQIQAQSGRRAGEVVFVGTGRLGEPAAAAAGLRNLRVLSVPDAINNCGLLRIGVRRSAADPDSWDVYVSARNYGAAPRSATLDLSFGPSPDGPGSSPVGAARLTMPPGVAREATFHLRTRAAGFLRAELLPHDGFPADDRAVLELPAQNALRVIVYSKEPDLLRPLLAAGPQVAAVFRDPTEYRPSPVGSLVILDRYHPPTPPVADSIWIDPPAAGSPVPVRARVTNAVFSHWLAGDPLGAGLRTRDLRLESASVFETAPDDLKIGEVEGGPVLVARPGKPKIVVLGFHPALGAMRYQLSTPLVFANILRWMAPTTFRHWELNAGAVGAVKVPLDADVRPADLRVLREDGKPVPFTLRDHALVFFSGTPGTVRVMASDREYVYSLTLPQLGETRWEIPAGTRRGIPKFPVPLREATDLWQWLALAGGIVLAAEWMWFGRRRGLAWKAATVAAILLALAQPHITIYESKVALAILADTSASVSPQDLDAASYAATALEKGRGRHWTRVVPFAAAPRNLSPRERAPAAWKLGYSPGQAAHGTNLESAVRAGIASLPAGFVPRLLLISDGNENLGSVTRAIWQAGQRDVPIDVIPLAGRPRPGLAVESVSMPGQVFSGERFPVDVVLNSPAVAHATVDMTAEGKGLGASRVELARGTNQFRAHASVTAAGAIEIAGRISAAGLGDARFASALTLRRPRVLLISNDPAQAEEHLLRLLAANQFDVTRAPDGPPEKLDDYQLVIFNNWNMTSVPPPRQAALEEFVKQGGGLLWIAGERNVYVEKKEDDALERALPAKLAPPRTPEGTCVVLIIDKSSSMEGKKMELARLAAIGVVENLRPIDEVGVLIFDNSYQWSVPLRRADDRGSIKRLIAGITPDGGTQIAPALAEAYHKILPTPAVYKHIVLLTDGISEEGDSMTLAQEALASHVTISTVGLGQDVNRAFLEKVAQISAGKSYFLNDPSGLEQIVLRDVQEHTGSSAIEKALHPEVVKHAEILDGVGIEQAPALNGYVRFTARPAADLILRADARDPLLVRWQFGLGRAAVFTSDAKNRWAANWVTWPGFDKLWTNIFRDLLPHATASEASAEFDRATSELVVDYRLGRHVAEPVPPPDIYAFGPDGFQSPLKLAKMAAGHYRARVPIGERRGLFRVRPLAESRAFPEVGFYRQEDEMVDYGANDQLLRQVAEATGGRYNPPLNHVFDAGGRSIATALALWPGLLALALALNLVELVRRKWRGVREGLRWAG